MSVKSKYKLLLYVAGVLIIAFVFSTLRSALTVNAEQENYLITFKTYGDTYHYEMALKDTLIDFPEDPAPRPGDAPFVGWYEEGTNKPFNPETLVSRNITLTAKFSKKYLATFKDVDNKILDIVEVTPKTAIPPPAKSPTLGPGEEFEYWMIVLDDGTTQRYDLNNSITKNSTFIPKIKGVSYAYFVTNGPEIETQIGPDGFLAEDPLDELGTAYMQRESFTFLRWSATPNGLEPYDFSKPITGSELIYAVWEPSVVGYYINYYNEKAGILGEVPLPTNIENKANYELVYTKHITQEESTVYAGQKTHIDADFANANYASGGAVLADTLDYSNPVYFEDKPLEGDGLTVINVYYQRVLYTYHFDLKTAYKTYDVKCWLELSDGTRYTGEVTDDYDGTYQLSAKLGQEIFDLWPFTAGSDDPSVANLRGTNWNGWYGFGPANLSSNYLKQGMNGNLPGRPPTNIQENIRLNLANAKYTAQRFYYLEVLPGECDLSDPDTKMFTALNGYPDQTNRCYKLGQVAVQEYQSANPATNAKNWPGRVIDGFETITAANLDGSKLALYFQEVVPDPEATQIYGLPSSDIYYYMRRYQYNLNIMLNGGTFTNVPGNYNPITDGYQEKIYYDAKINTPPAPKKSGGYEFVGWYLDELFTEEYVPNTKMPAADLTLYAKYVGQGLNINYYDGDQLIKSSSYAENEFVSKFDLSGTEYSDYVIGEEVPGKGIFGGWVYYKSGLPVYFNIDIYLKKSYDLYAKWDEVTYSINYLNNLELDENKEAIFDDEYTEFAPSQQVKSGKNNTLAKSGLRQPVPQKIDDYYFVGWNTQKDGSGVYVTAATQITENMDLYAVWKYDKGLPLNLLVTNEEDEPLNEAKFTVYECIYLESDPLKKLGDCLHNPTGITLASDEYGLATFSSLITGTYDLFETETNDGYDPPKGGWVLTIDSDIETLAIEPLADDSGEMPISRPENDDLYHVINKKTPKKEDSSGNPSSSIVEEVRKFLLPITSGNGIIVYVAISIMFIGTACLLMLTGRRGTF